MVLLLATVKEASEEFDKKKTTQERLSARFDAQRSSSGGTSTSIQSLEKSSVAGQQKRLFIKISARYIEPPVPSSGR